MNKILSILFFTVFSIVKGDGVEGYRFISNFQNDEIIEVEIMTEFSQSIYNYMTTFSARIKTEYIKNTKSSYEHEFLQTWTDIISTSIRNDKVQVNYDDQKLSGCQFSFFVDSTGSIEKIAGVNDLSREMIESAESYGFYLGGSNNLLYPFGSDSIRSVGDTWTITDEKNNLEEVPGFDTGSGKIKRSATYTLKKVKEKGGSAIAYINMKSLLEISAVTNTWDESWEIDMTGDYRGVIRYDITRGEFIKTKISATIKGGGRDLIDDEEFTFFQSLDLRMKGK